MRRGAWFNIDYYRDKQYFGDRSDANVKWHMSKRCLVQTVDVFPES